jgi:RimJ/RimL family protein N-acetyltransferase
MFARTQRLLLRPGWIQDAPALFRAICDARVVRNLSTPPWPYALEDAEAFLARERRAGDPTMLIFRRSDGEPELIGAIGFNLRAGAEAELGYWIARPHWGRGYAGEAGRAAVALARHGLRLKRLTAGHFLDNPASGRVLEKLGFRPTGKIVPHFSAGRGGTTPCRLFELEFDQEAELEPAAMAA